MKSFEAYKFLFEMLEISHLERIDWQQDAQHPAVDVAPFTEYLEESARMNLLQRICLEQNPKQCCVESAIVVLRDWYRSTHRPPDGTPVMNKNEQSSSPPHHAVRKNSC
jgi:hypothetical protein